MVSRSAKPIRLHSRLLDVPTLQLAFNNPQAAYQKTKPHQLPRLHEGLKDKARRNFDTARDLVETLEGGRFPLLKNATVVADNRIRSFYDYVVLQDHNGRQDNYRRVRAYLERLMQTPEKTLQAALEVTVGGETRTPYISQIRGRFRTLSTFADIPIEGGAVRPQVNFDYDMLEQNQSEIRGLFKRGENLMVLGYFRLQRITGAKNPVYFLRADIGNPALVVPFDHTAVVAAGMAADERRRTRPWLKPFQFGAN